MHTLFLSCGKFWCVETESVCLFCLAIRMRTQVSLVCCCVTPGFVVAFDTLSSPLTSTYLKVGWKFSLWQSLSSSIFLLIPKFSRTGVPTSRELFSALLPLPVVEDHCLILMLWPKVLQVSLLSPALEQALHTCALGGFRGDVPALPLPPSEVDCHHLPLCVRSRVPEGFSGSRALPSDFSRPLHLS